MCSHVDMQMCVIVLCEGNINFTISCSFFTKEQHRPKKEKRKDLEFTKKKTYVMHNFFAIYDWLIYIFISFAKILLEKKDLGLVLN